MLQCQNLLSPNFKNCLKFILKIYMTDITHVIETFDLKSALLLHYIQNIRNFCQLPDLWQSFKPLNKISCNL